jgi:zinc protease
VLPAGLLLLFSTGQPDMVPLLRLPEFTDTTLANGLRVLVAEDHQQPAVFLRLLVKAGERIEPRGKEGLAGLTAALLDQGTGTRTAEEIAEAVDSIGAKLQANALAEYTSVGCDVLSKDIRTGIDLFADVVQTPVFPGRELARLKQQQTAELRQVRSDPTTIARNHALNLLFGSEDRLGRVRTERSVRSIRTEDVRAFHQQHFRPDNALLMAIGDFQAGEMLGQLTERFGRWEAPCRQAGGIRSNGCGQVPENSKGQPRISGSSVRNSGTVPDFAERNQRDNPQFRPRFRFVNKPDLTQGTIAIIGPGIEERNPDRLAFQLMDYILVGGSFSSRLYSVIRAQEGRTYHVGGLRSHLSDCGIWGLWTFTRTEEIVSTVERLQAELAKFIQDGVSDEELAKARSFYLGALPLSLESPHAVAVRVLDDLFYGTPLEEQREELQRLAAATRADVNRVAQRWLKPDQFQLVIVGNLAGVKSELERLGRYELRDWRAPVVR